MSAGSYVLFGNATEDALRRLRSIEAVWDPGTFHALRELGVGPGWRCLEVGAGAGSVARWLAEVVGPSGEVVASDIDTNFLSESSGANLRVVAHDIVAEALPAGDFDLIHARMVLQHLPGRAQALRRMVGALAPGGLLLLEDSDWTTLFRSEPALPDLVELKAGMARVMARAGFEVTQGIRNLAALEALGLEQVTASGRVQLMRAGSPGIEWYAVWLQRLRDGLRDEGIEEALVERALGLFASGEQAWMSQTLVATSGRRPTVAA